MPFTPKPLPIKKGFTPRTVLPQEQEKTSFLKGEITGQPQKTGFVGSLVQETVGSKGILGFIQNLGKTIGQKKILKESSALNESLGNLADTTRKAIVGRRTITDPDRRKVYDKMIADNVQTLRNAGADVSALEKMIVTPGQMAATTLRTLATLAPVKGLGVAQRIGVAGAQGMAYGASTPLEEGKSATDVVKGATVGGITGIATAGILEGIGAGFRKLVDKTRVQKKLGYTFNKELQPPVKELAADIQKGFKTFGESVAGVVDDKGNPVYAAKTYSKILETAKNEVSTNGRKLESLIKQFDSANNPIVNKADVAGDIIEKMTRDYGKLSPSQISKIKFEIDRMPEKMSVWGVEEIKRLYDKLIPDSFWDNLATGNEGLHFPALIKYYLRDNARNIINSVTNSPIINELNTRMGIGMEVSKLVSRQMGQRINQKITGQGGFFYKLVGRFIDDVLFNPAITTRGSSMVQKLGQKTGQTLPRQIERRISIKGMQQIFQPKTQ